GEARDVWELHPDGRPLLCRGRKGLELVDVRARRVLQAIPTPGVARLAAFTAGGQQVVTICSGAGGRAPAPALVVFGVDGKELLSLPLPFEAKQYLFVAPAGAVGLLGPGRKELAVCRLEGPASWERRPLPTGAAVAGLSSGPKGELYVVRNDRLVETWGLDPMGRKSECRWDGGDRPFLLFPAPGLSRLLTLEAEGGGPD